MGPWASRLLVEVPGYIVSQLQSRFPPNFFKYRMLQIALRGLPGMQAHVSTLIQLALGGATHTIFEALLPGAPYRFHQT
jgi:hypothetical protein